MSELYVLYKLITSQRMYRLRLSLSKYVHERRHLSNRLSPLRFSVLQNKWFERKPLFSSVSLLSTFITSWSQKYGPWSCDYKESTLICYNNSSGNDDYRPRKYFKDFFLKALDTIGIWQRPCVLSLGVSQHMHQIINLWKFLALKTNLNFSKSRQTLIALTSMLFQQPLSSNTAHLPS